MDNRSPDSGEPRASGGSALADLGGEPGGDRCRHLTQPVEMALVREPALDVDEQRPGPVLETGLEGMLRQQDLQRRGEQLAQKELVLGVVDPELAAVAELRALEHDRVTVHVAEPLRSVEHSEQPPPPAQENAREQARAGLEVDQADREVARLTLPGAPARVALSNLERVVAKVALHRIRERAPHPVVEAPAVARAEQRRERHQS